MPSVGVGLNSMIFGQPGGEPAPPPEVEDRVTSDGEVRVTSDDEVRVVES